MTGSTKQTPKQHCDLHTLRLSPAYDRLKKFGLEEKQIRNLEFVISFYFDNRREEFLASNFKEKFNGREVVKVTIAGVNRNNLH